MICLLVRFKIIFLNKKQGHAYACPCFYLSLFTFFIARDLDLEAVFFLIIPFFAALSRVTVSFLISSCAFVLSADSIAFRKCLLISLILANTILFRSARFLF